MKCTSMSHDSSELDRDTVSRVFDPEGDDPNMKVLAVISDLEDCDPRDCSPLYTTIDDVIADIYEDPPSPDADVEITFSYEGYRITLRQDGRAEFVPVE